MMLECGRAAAVALPVQNLTLSTSREQSCGRFGRCAALLKIMFAGL